jgi:hypothetical protein
VVALRKRDFFTTAAQRTRREESFCLLKPDLIPSFDLKWTISGISKEGWKSGKRQFFWYLRNKNFLPAAFAAPPW